MEENFPMKLSTIFRNSKVKNIALKIIAAAFWIIVWEALALSIDSELIIASPISVARKLLSMIAEANTWQSLLFSLIRISIGFISAFILGSFFAALSSKIPAVKILLSPITTIIKSTPVASFIILAIIWFGSKNLSIFISFLMVFPVIYLNLLKGIESVDKNLSEMAFVFGMPLGKRIIYIYMPQIMPFVISACSVALGLCWKSGIAAEVIGISTGSIGERLYRAKLYFETGELLAWTAIIILLSTTLEKLVMLVLRHTAAIPENSYSYRTINRSSNTMRSDRISAGFSGIKLNNIEKSFGDVKILDKISINITSETHLALMGHSGSGKTTLTRLIAGLEEQDTGEVIRQSNLRLGYVFQEDRLVECLNSIGNSAIAGGDIDSAYKLLKKFGLSDELIFKPCRTLSGGEKRRVAIVRAIVCDPDILILDEPFKGIDNETIFSAVIPEIKKAADKKAMILITHSEDEAKELSSEIIKLE